MQLPDSIIKTGITLEDQFFDLKGLSVYSSLGISSLRYHIKENGLPAFKIPGKKDRHSGNTHINYFDNGKMD